MPSGRDPLNDLRKALGRIGDQVVQLPLRRIGERSAARDSQPVAACEEAMADPAMRRMTPEEFFAWQLGQDGLYELVDGVPVPHVKMLTGASAQHDRVTVDRAIVPDVEGPPPAAVALDAGHPADGPRCTRS